MPTLATGLAFVRKKQTLDSLATERPQSLQSVYAVVRDNIGHVLDHVQALERAYYGPGGSAESEAKHWMPIITEVMRSARLPDLVSLSQLDAVNDRVQDPTDRLSIDPDLIKQLYDLVAKIRHALREEDARQLQRLREFMHKYCQSFSGPEGETYLQTATNYEKQKRELETAVAVNLGKAPVLLEAFERDALRVQHLDYPMKEAAEKAGCTQAPFLLLFPAACLNVRNACKGLEMWVEEDANYPGYLQMDVEELAAKRQQAERALHQHGLAVGELEHRSKSLQRDITACLADLARLEIKREALEQEEAKQREEHHDLQVSLEVKEYRRQRMKTQGEESCDRYLIVIREIEDLRMRKPALDRKLAELQKKLSVIFERQNRRDQLQAELDSVKVSMRSARKALRKADVELERVDACVNRLREIHRLKTSPETLKKIFHGLPTSPRHPTPHVNGRGVGGASGHIVKRNKRDKLDAVLHTVAQTIEVDWMDLYHALPFYPPRGDHIVDEDVGDLSSRCLRQNNEELARQSLAKWRRLHTRARVEDVRGALAGIGRQDVLERVDSLLTPKSRPSVPPKKFRTVRFPKLPCTTPSRTGS